MDLSPQKDKNNKDPCCCTAACSFPFQRNADFAVFIRTLLGTTAVRYKTERERKREDKEKGGGRNRVPTNSVPPGVGIPMQKTNGKMQIVNIGMKASML